MPRKMTARLTFANVDQLRFRPDHTVLSFVSTAKIADIQRATSPELLLQRWRDGGDIAEALGRRIFLDGGSQPGETAQQKLPHA